VIGENTLDTEGLEVTPLYRYKPENRATGPSRPALGRRFRMACLMSAFLLLAAALPCAAQYTAPTITVTEPDGVSDKVVAADEYAEKVLQDPWDLDQETDFHYFIDEFRDSGFTTSNGDTVWTGVSLPTPQTSDPDVTSDCSIMILHPGADSALNVGKKGLNYPINANSYRYLTFRMYVSEKTQTQLLWFNGVIHNPPEPGDTSASEFFTVYEGWRIYTVDLASLATLTGPAWGGTTYGLRIDPTNEKDVRVTLDWVRLHQAPGAGNVKTVQWNHTDPNGSAVVSLFASTESTLGRGLGAVYDVIAMAADATPGQYDWNVGHLPGETLNVFGLIGEEYAQVVLNDPWDMSQATDIESYDNVTGVTFSGGIMRCTSTNDDPQISPAIDDRYPIDAATFPILSFRMYLSAANSYKVLFLREGETTWRSIDFQPAQTGWQTYSVDMRSSGHWNGTITKLRLDPTTLAGPVDIRLDWVTLNTINSSTAGEDTTDLSLSPGPVTVNHVPTITFEAPSWDTGADFAATELGDAWDLAQSTDLKSYRYLTNVSFTAASGFTGTTTDWDSRMMFLDLTGQTVDADTYNTLSFDLMLEGPIADPADTSPDVFRYDVARILFRTGHVVSESCTDDVVLSFGYQDHPTISGLRSQDRSGWIRYHVHLPDAALEPDSEVFDDIPWGGDEGWFRIDASEYGETIGGGRTYRMRNVKLTADDESWGEYTIRWADRDPDDNARIVLYYDDDNSGYDGTLINESSIYENEDGSGGSYVWQTGGIPEGRYWLHATITDTTTVTKVYSPRPVYVHYTEVPDTEPPYLADQYPPPGSVGASPYTMIMTHVRDDWSGPDPTTLNTRVDGSPVTPAVSGGGRDLVLEHDPSGTLDHGQNVTVRVIAWDQADDPHLMDESYSFRVTSSQDSDGDGLPDEWETMNGLDPGRGSGDSGADGDADGDGQTNEEEYYNGTDPTSPALILAAPGAGEENPPDGQGFYTDGAPVDWLAFTAYGVDAWGLNMAGGDIDGDGMDEIVTGPGPGTVFGPHVRGWNLADDTVAAIPQVSYLAYGTNKYGVNVATGDIDADGYHEIVTGAGPGAVFGPHVRGWNYDGTAVSAIGAISYFAYGTPKFGVNVACGDIDGDGYDEIITGAGPGQVYGPHVRGWNYDGGAVAAIGTTSFLAYGTNQWGVNVACGDIDGDGIDEIVTGPGPGTVFGPHVRGWNVDGGQASAIGQVSFFAFDTTRWGANVACGDFDGDGIDEIVAGAGPGPDFMTEVRAYDWDGSGAAQAMSEESFRAFGPTVAYGARVGAVRLGD